MPLLDVSDVLIDPDFADDIVVHRQAVTIGDDGFSTRTESIYATSAVVTPDRQATLQRQAEGSIVSETITVISQFRLIPSGEGYDGDEIIWNGKCYLVRAVGDCSRYGAGFIEASCDYQAAPSTDLLDRIAANLGTLDFRNPYQSGWQ